MKTPLLLSCVSLLATLPASAITRTWDGGGAADNFNDAANWNPDGVPANGDDLVFPTIAPATVTNDLAGRTFGSLSFPAGTTLAGNAFTLTGGITVSGTVGGGRSDVTIGANVTLGADQTFSSGGVGALTFGGNVSFGARTLTVAGARPVIFQGLTGSSTAGSRLVKSSTGLLRLDTSCILVTAQPFSFSTGTLDVDGFVQTPVTMTNGTLTGEGNLGLGLDASGGDIVPDAGDLDVSGATVLRGNVNLRVSLLGASSETQLSCGGVVTLQDQATMEVISTAYTPVRGEGFQVLTKSPAGAITGTFSNAPAGTDFPAGTSVLRLSYVGGNGNDAVLTTVSTTRTWDGDVVINDNWDEADNWSANLVPQSGDVLLFPAGIQSSDRGLDNNFPNDTTFRQLVFNGDDFTVRGNRFRLSHGIDVAQGVQANLDTDAVLALDQTFTLNGRLHLDALDEIDTNGRTLTLVSAPAMGGVVDGDIAGSGGVVVAPGAQITFEERTTYSGITSIQANGSLTVFALQIGPGGASLGSSAGGTEIRGTLTLENARPNDAMRTEDDLRLFPGGTLRLVDGFGHILGNESRIEVAGDLILEGTAADALHMEMIKGRDDVMGVISGGGALNVDINVAFDDESLGFSGPNNNTFTGPLTVTGGRLLLEKANPGVLAVSCASLIITGEDATVETRQDEQIADNCHVQVLDGAVLNIGDITGRTETIGSLDMRRKSSVLGANNSRLHLRGNIHAGEGSEVPGAAVNPLISVATEIQGMPCVVDVDGGTELTTLFGGTLTRSGTGSIRKVGLGKVFFSAPISVPCELQAGEAVFNDSGSGSPVTMNGGTLSGDSACGSITSSTGGGVVRPGIPNGTAILTKALNCGAIIWNAVTTLKIEITNSTAGSGHSQLLAQGTVGLGGATLQLVERVGFNIPLGGQVFPLLNDGTDAIIGTFAGLPQGTFIPISAANGGGGWTISYTGGDGNDVSLTRVVTPPVEVQPTVTTVTFGTADVNGNRPVTIAGKGTPGASYRLENSVNLTQWFPEGTAQTANATTGALSFSSSARPPVRLKQFWRFRKL